MPNLQQWLNVWVNVNTPAKTTLGHNHSNRHHRSSGKPHSTGAIGAHQSVSAAAENAVVKEAGQVQVVGNIPPKDSGGFAHSLSLATATESLQSTSGSSSDALLLATSAELAAIRKFNSKKHKRRLYRTNSFSDLLREQAANARSSRLRSSGSNSQRHSVQRDSSSRRAEAARERRRHTHHSQQQQQHRHCRPAPPTLHHHLTEDKQHDAQHVALESSSSHSNSPTETATTVQRSNQQPSSAYRNSRYHHDADEHSVASSNGNSAALFEMADFFGTDRPIMRSSARQTHRAQHGLEDEQPHYLRSYINSSGTENIHHLHHSESSTSYSSHKNNNTNTRQHHTTAQLQQARLSAGAYPPALANHYYDEATSSSLMPPSHTPIERNAPVAATKTAEAGIVVGGMRLPFFSSAASTSSNNNKCQNNNHETEDNKKNSNPFGGKANCPGCKVAQAELQRTQESVEYMREMAIRKEYSCSKCESDGDAIKAPVLEKSSQQLSELTERHKKQVELLMRERNHWQRNMHLKLEKYAVSCQKLNTESAARSEETQALKDELEQIRLERDQLAGEGELLKAAVQVYEKEREYHRHVQDKMATYESQGLQQLQEGIAKRDQTIAKLSARLETSLDSLAKEREQQRQRRQIIFPPVASKMRNGNSDSNGHNVKEDVQNGDHNNGYSVSTNNSNLANGIQQAELEWLREELIESKRKLETSQREANQKETALLFRCDSLERQLNNGGTKSPGRKPPRESHPLRSGKN